jgi:hypothetical protein
LQTKTKIVSCHTADSKPVKQEVNGTVILPPLVFPALMLGRRGERSTTVLPLLMNFEKAVLPLYKNEGRDEFLLSWPPVTHFINILRVYFMAVEKVADVVAAGLVVAAWAV